MGSFARFVFYLALGAVIGLGSAWYLLEEGISLDSVEIGPWLLRTDAGQPVADPYTSAYVARTGHIPIRLEGAMYLTAQTADDGTALSGACDFSIEGPALSGGWWSISLHTPDGELFENTARRYSFTETSMVFEDDGTFRIRVSPNARPGNWLPSPKRDEFVLVTRIHGPDPGYLKSPTSVSMPTIATKACR